MQNIIIEQSTYKTGSDLSGTPSVDFSETITYNENSAPITLKRWGQTHAGAKLLDDLTYTYNGNQLQVSWIILIKI